MFCLYDESFERGRQLYLGVKKDVCRFFLALWTGIMAHSLTHQLHDQLFLLIIQNQSIEIILCPFRLRQISSSSDTKSKHQQRQRKERTHLQTVFPTNPSNNKITRPGHRKNWIVDISSDISLRITNQCLLIYLIIY